jgi:hypothetical protein
MQWLGLCVSHLLNVLFSSVVLCRPFLAVAHRNFRRYHLALAACSMANMATIVSVFVPFGVARVPRVMQNDNGSDPTWLLLTADVVEAMNTSALCAQFPSATAFAAFNGC